MRGCAEVDSMRNQATVARTNRANRPSTDNEVHPQLGSWLTPVSRATRPTHNAKSALGLMRPPAMTGESGMTKWASTAAAAVRIIGVQNSQWNPRAWTIGPPTTTPMPPAAVAVAAATPTAPATLRAGNSSRRIPNASGMTPPPIPWTPRPTNMSGSEVASAARSEPTARALMAHTKVRLLPIMSPTRPTMGVNTEAETRYEVKTQLTPRADVGR